MSGSGLSATLGSAKRRVLSDEVTSQLRVAIVTGAIPPGERLREDELALTMEVSRGPVREALTRLQREGLVVIEQFKGAKVAALYRDDIDQLFSLRTSLESLAVDWACSKATEEDFERLYSILRRFDEADPAERTPEQVAELDFEFHDVLVQAAHHERLSRAWEGIRAQISAFLVTRMSLRLDYVEVWAADHRKLVDQIRDMDKEDAIAHITHHILLGYNRVVQAMENRE